MGFWQRYRAIDARDPRLDGQFFTAVRSTNAPKIVDVAFAAGSSSVRQFNDTIGEVFAVTPTALRGPARVARTAAPAAPSPGLTLNLPIPVPTVKATP